jgi:hypothetical protein
MTDNRADRLDAIVERYPKPTGGSIAVTVPEWKADLWFMLDTLALYERTIARVAMERDRERMRADAAVRLQQQGADPAKLMDVFFNGRKA